MQAEQIEVLQTCNAHIFSDVKALNPVVVDQMHSERVSNLLKYPVIPNQKEPRIAGWTNPKRCKRSAFNGNYGVITGEANNLIVVDVDNKDDGFEEFQLYINEHGLPNTYTVKTPRNGLHFILIAML